MNAEEIVSLLAEFYSGTVNDQARFSAMSDQIEQIKKNTDYVQTAIEMLSNYNEPPVVWLASQVIENLIVFHWTPRSLNPNPALSGITPETKMQFRTFFLNYMKERIDVLNVTARNFILKVIVTMMKVDYPNEGVFWLSYCQENLANPEEQHKAMVLIRFMCDELQPITDHTISTGIRSAIKKEFLSIIPDITEQIIRVLTAETTLSEKTLSEVFPLLKSFLLCIPPSNLSFELVQVIMNYSRYEVGEVSLLAHQCICSLFSRIDVGSGHNKEFRAYLSRVVIEFFGTVMKDLCAARVDNEYTESLLKAFQPFAQNYFFKQEDINSSIIVSFLTEFEAWTWGMLGTENFTHMLEIWHDLLQGSGQSMFQQQFLVVVEHLLQAMTSPEHIPAFTEDGYSAAVNFINDTADQLAQCDPEFGIAVGRLVHRVTAFAVNMNLPSIVPIMNCLFHVIDHFHVDDPVNESISDSLLKYINELLTKEMCVDVPNVFCVTLAIVTRHMKKFAKNSLHFLEKIFHLVTVAIGAGPDFLEPMMQLFLETVSIYRPQNPCRMILARLLDMHPGFCSLRPSIYSLYICSCEIIAAHTSTDGDAPLGSVEVVQQIFGVLFESLTDPSKALCALTILKQAIDNIMFTTRVTKELVFRALLPYIDLILAIYESAGSPEVIGTVLDFLASYCRIFLTQIAERMSELINRLLAPLLPVLPSLTDGSFEFTAIESLLSILDQLASFHNPIADLQTQNVTGFLLTFADPLLHSPSVDVRRLSFGIIRTLLMHRWSQIPVPEMKHMLLRLLFFEGVCADDPECVKTSISTFTKQGQWKEFAEFIDREFLTHAFAAICRETCQCSQTMMRDSMVDFATFICQNTPDFMQVLFVPFIQGLAVEDSDKEILLGMFAACNTADDFKTIFITFCNDIAYLFQGRE